MVLNEEKKLLSHEGDLVTVQYVYTMHCLDVNPGVYQGASSERPTRKEN